MSRIFLVVLLAGVMAGTAAARVIETQSVVFKHNEVRARVTWSATSSGSTRVLLLSLSTRRPSAKRFHHVVTVRLDYWRTGFEPRSFIVAPRRDSAIVEVAWRRRGIVDTRWRYYRATANGLRRIGPVPL